jgi:glycosyltransferase involved in cell wall biosynthesis
VVDGDRQDLLATKMPRPGTITSGDWWWGILALEGADHDREVRIELEGKTRFRRRVAAIPLGTVSIRAREHRGYQSELALQDPAPAPGSIMGFVELQPLVSICLPIDEPGLGLLDHAVTAIRGQSYANWRCVVCNDSADTLVRREIERILEGDDRFELFSAPEPAGRQINAQRALELAHDEAPYVALANPADRWHPRRLELTLAAFETSTLMVYNDILSVVDGKPLVNEDAASARGASSGCHDFGPLLLRSPVRAGATIVRRELLRYALPRPPQPAEIEMEHWLALTAKSLGTVRYIDSPLSEQVASSGVAARYEERTGSRNWRGDYFDNVAAGAVVGEMLKLRCWDLMRPSDRRALSRYLKGVRGKGTLRFFAWLRRQTQVEDQIRAAYQRGVSWQRFAGWRARLARPSGDGPSSGGGS